MEGTMETPKKRAPRKPASSSSRSTRTATTAARAAAPVEPTHEAIARRAYDLYVHAGGVHGRDVEFWLTAERELKGKRHA